MKFFMITTDHLSEAILFRDEDDFKIGMSHVAAIACHLEINVLAFVLMSNHVHFVISCESLTRADDFIIAYKRLYARYYEGKYGVKELLRRNRSRFDEVFVGDESLEKVIAYVMMNPVVANICQHPSAYTWGSANCYFRVDSPHGLKTGSISKRAQARLFHTRIPVNKEYIIDNGYIRPESFICSGFVQKLFRTPRRYDFFLRNSTKAKAKFESGKSMVPSFKDQIIIAAIPDICNSLFWTNDYKSLDEKDLSRLIHELNHRFCADPKQIARILGIEPSEVARNLLAF